MCLIEKDCVYGRGCGDVLRLFYSMRDLAFEKLSKIYGLDVPDKHYMCREFYDYLVDVFFRVPGAVYAVWEMEGEYISALRAEPYLDGFLIEALETACCHRNKGYAKALLYAFLKSEQVKQCYPIYAHVHKKNEASLKTHMGCGFVRVLDHAEFIDGSVYQHSCTLKRTV